MLVGDAAGDGEAEAVAGFVGVEPDEAFEDALAVVFRYAGTVIGDVRLDISIQPSEVHVDSSGGLDGRKRVVYEITEDAFERVRVATHGGVLVGAECDRRLRCALECVFDEWACDRGEVDRRPGWMCFEAGESKEVVDEAAESLGVAGDGCFEAVALGPFGLFAQESFDACLKGGDRGAELVGGVGEEAAGCGVAGACVLDGCLEGVDHLIEGGGEVAELRIGAAGPESELGLALGDACCGIDDAEKGSESGAGSLKDEEARQHERASRDQELDEK